MAHTHHEHGAACNHDHSHDHDQAHGHKIKNKDNLDLPAEADIDLDAMHPEVQIPMQQYPLTEQELRDDFVMLTEDGGIKKKILIESKEKDLGTPPKNSKVICHYTGTLPNNNDEKFDSSRDRDDPFEFKIGQSQVIKGWDIGIASMNKGERCILRCASPYAYGEHGSPPKIPGGATLDFDVELIEWDDWQSCEGADGQISKKILIESEDYGDKISSNSKINISYRIYYLENGIDQILCERQNYDMTVDDDDRLTEAMHIAIKSMKKNEKSRFKILDKKLLNIDDIYIENENENEYNNNKQKAPNNKRTYYEIDIHSVIKAKESWNAKNEEKIEESLIYKQDGNVLFKQERFLGAIKKYKKALDWIDNDFSDNELASKKEELIVSTNNNLSLIYIKMKDWSSAIEHASIVLEKEPNNVKALMRRGQARLQEGYLDLSKKDLKKAASFDKSNTYIKRLLKICATRHKEYVEKQQKLYAGMFGQKKVKKKKKKKDNKQNDDNIEIEENKQNDETNEVDVDVAVVKDEENKTETNVTEKVEIESGFDKLDVDSDKAVTV